jgi:hypothetical protein
MNRKSFCVVCVTLIATVASLYWHAYMLLALLVLLGIVGCTFAVIVAGREERSSTVDASPMPTLPTSPSPIELQAVANAGINFYRGKSTYCFVAHQPNEKR